MRKAAFLVLLLALPAAADPPPHKQLVPPALIEADHYVAYDAYCPGPEGVTGCTVYIVRHRQCEPCIPVPEPGSYLGLGACVLGLAWLRRWRRDEKV